MLGCALVACSDRPSTVEPRASVPALEQSGPPTPVEPGQFEDPIASEICGFPYLVEATGKLKTLDLPGGRTFFMSPGLKGTITNGNTGTTVTLPLTGPIQFNPLPNGGTELVFTGHNIVGDPEAGWLVLIIGHFNAIFDAEGDLVQSLAGTGQQIDLCALLA
jgi:hypothetical protein